MRRILPIICLLTLGVMQAQKLSVLSYTEYIAIVKKHHPYVKQANLVLASSEAKLLKARGAFDPKLSLDVREKQFKNTNYYTRLSTGFKIPTWYGISLEGKYEKNTGKYLNPEASVPDNGLYSAGLQVSIGKNMFIDQRRASLQQAKYYQKQAVAERTLQMNQILYEASLQYFKWVKRHKELQLYSNMLSNSKTRLDAVRKSYEMGDKPAIDTTEARIVFFNRKIALEKAKLANTTAKLELANYLWVDQVPLELQDHTIPEIGIRKSLSSHLNLPNNTNNLNLHPKLLSLDYKEKSLAVDKQLQQNNLLPEIQLKYQIINESLSPIQQLETDNYKAALGIRFPLFLRKERAALKLATYKLEAIQWEQEATRLSLQNKQKAIVEKIEAYEKQLLITEVLLTDYNTLLKGEERKFNAGESSLFMINSRESKLIENQLKAIALENSFLQAKSELFLIMIGKVL